MYLWVLRCWDPHPAKAIFSSGVINLFSQVSEPQIFRFSGRRVWRFFVPGTPGTVRRQIFFPCRWEDEGKGVEEKPPKTEMPWMMRCLILRSVFWFLIFIAQLKDPQRILYICSRRWRKETSSKMFLMMSSLLHIVYDVSWCVSIFYSSFHDFESCLIHLSSQSSRPPMFVHSNHGPSQRLSAIGKTGATRALWQTSLRIGALRGVSLRCEVDYSVTAV